MRYTDFLTQVWVGGNPLFNVMYNTVTNVFPVIID